MHQNPVAYSCDPLLGVFTEQDRGTTIGGWLLVLCGYLAVWQPLTLAAVAAESLAALPVRGWQLGALLVVRIAIIALGIGAVIAIFDRKPAALALTRAALFLSGAMELFVYSTSVFPNNRLPGTTPFYMGWTIVFHGGWLLYLARSARVRRTLG